MSGQKSVKNGLSLFFALIYGALGRIGSTIVRMIGDNLVSIGFFVPLILDVSIANNL